ncbi:MAG: hypothetical protein R3B96_04600 [Pirellulaceae bacterium]
MKWILFVSFVMFAMPVLCGASMAHRAARQLILSGLIYSTVLKLSVNFAYLEGYRGPDRGYEVHMTDLLAICLAFGLLRHWRTLVWLPFNTLPQVAFAALAVVSAYEPTASFHAGFTIFRLFKGLALYWIVYNSFRGEDGLGAMWWACVAILLTETGFAFKQKYVNHLYRVNGTFDHSNTIPAYLLLIMPMLLAWALYGDRLRLWQRGLSVFAVLGGAFAIAATMSRFGLAMMGLTLVLTVGRLVVARPTRLNLALVGSLALVIGTGAVLAMDNYIDRFLNAPKESAQSRDEFNFAAERMAEDRFFGVGINCFSEVMTVKHRYHAHLKHMAYEASAGVCHHIYRLTMAELGYIGLATFLLILVRFFLPMAWEIRGRIRSLEQALLLGLVIGAFALHGIGLFEWVFRLTPVGNLFLITSALGTALLDQLRANRRKSGAWEVPHSALPPPRRQRRRLRPPLARAQ